MNEEQVTKAILKWLIDNHWTIICYDFPQNGTGKMLHPNGDGQSKNRNAIIPDIVAVNKEQCLFFENKDRFYHPDFVKQNELIVQNEYLEAINALLRPYSVEQIHYGIGLPKDQYSEKAAKSKHLVDFIICVNETKEIDVEYNPHEISFDPHHSQPFFT